MNEEKPSCSDSNCRYRIFIENELALLKKAVREYLNEPSIDGRAIRVEMRQKLKEMTK